MPDDELFSREGTADAVWPDRWNQIPAKAPKVRRQADPMPRTSYETELGQTTRRLTAAEEQLSESEETLQTQRASIDRLTSSNQALDTSLGTKISDLVSAKASIQTMEAALRTQRIGIKAFAQAMMPSPDDNRLLQVTLEGRPLRIWACIPLGSTEATFILPISGLRVWKSSVAHCYVGEGLEHFLILESQDGVISLVVADIEDTIWLEQRIGMRTLPGSTSDVECRVSWPVLTKIELENGCKPGTGD